MIKALFTLGPVVCMFLMGCAPAELDEAISAEALEAPPPEIAPLDDLLQAPETRLSAEDAEALLARARATEARVGRSQ
ncbi:MAG: hypothetical protein QNJ03_00045 [Dinoroseobacter sp.]|nr:hypothetical protein [Dinoroseobacter sp.]